MIHRNTRSPHPKKYQGTKAHRALPALPTYYLPPQTTSDDGNAAHNLPSQVAAIFSTYLNTAPDLTKLKGLLHGIVDTLYQ